MKNLLLVSLLVFALGQAHAAPVQRGKAKYDTQDNFFTIITFSDGTKCVVFTPSEYYNDNNIGRRMQCKISDQPSK